MKNLLLIDCNAMLNVYYYGSLPEQLKKDDDPKYYGMISHNKYGVYNNAIIPFLGMLQTAIKELNVTHIACAFDMGSKTFRKQESQEYKANRKGCPFPLKEQVEILRNSLKTCGISCYISDLYEADDIVGTIAERSKNDMDNVYIITTDHDYFQLVQGNVIVCGYTKGKEYENLKARFPDNNIFGRFFKYDGTMVKQTTGVYPAQIKDYKGLAGDQSDNIQGVSSIGKGYASKILSLYPHGEDLFTAIKNNPTEVKEKLTNAGFKAFKALISPDAEEQFLRSKRLATIQKDVRVGSLGEYLRLKVNKKELDEFKKFIK